MYKRQQLTRAGQFMLDHACKIIDAYQNLDFDMKKLTEKSGGELRIGASKMCIRDSLEAVG